MLFERLELYRKRVEQMNAYEVDRQRSFDEIERARAEMFTEMNVKLEEQRREIQRLNKQLSASEARDECVSTVLGNNERNAFMMESQRPSDTGLKMDKDIQEVVDNIELSDANVDEYMQAILRNIVEQETSNAVSKENVALPVGDVGKREAELQLIKSQCQLGGWEEKERLDNVYEGLWKFVDILLWSRRAIAQFACEADIRTVTCRKEAAAYEDKLAKIRSPVASQEQRDQELEGQLGQLQQEIKFCTVVRESKPKEEGDGFLKIQESELFEYIKTTSASRGLEDQPSLSASIEVTGGDSGGVKTLTNSKNISSVGIGFASIRSVEDGQATKEEVSPCVQRGVECLACEPGLRIGTETVGETGIKEIDSILWAGENKSSNHLHEQEGRTSTKSLEQSMKFPPPLDKSNVAQQTLQDVFQDSEWDVHLAPTIGDLKSQSKRSTQGPAPCEINQELYSAKEDQQYRETSGGKCTTNLDNLFDLTTVPQQQTPQAPVKLSGSSSFLGEFDPFA
ncbi:hypothetical protein ERJ75_001238400 [Trypanosoma vivax]|nr:hypothetical protein ERJ75_001238400 [Trypanosoma vivax]